MGPGSPGRFALDGKPEPEGQCPSEHEPPGERVSQEPRDEPPVRGVESPHVPGAPAPVKETERCAAVGPRHVSPEPPVQQLAAQMLRGVSVHRLDGRTSLKMELSTPGLSRVGLALHVDRGRLSARISVPDLAGRELIRAASDQLEAGLSARGIGVQEIRVEVDAPEASGGLGARQGRDRRGGQSGQDHRGRDRPPARRDGAGHKAGFVL